MFLAPRVLLLLAVVGVSLWAAASTPAGELTAGVARVDLTPPKDMPTPLGGYGERMNRPAEGVHDRIFAKALVLRDGDRKFVLVTADLLGFSPPVKPALVERLSGDGWTSEQILLLASHSHTSIEMNAFNPANTFNVPQIGIHSPRVFDFVLDRLTQVIRDAEKTLVPVSIGTTSVAIEGWNRNRRGGAFIDKDLIVTRIDKKDDKKDGQPLAVLVGFTAHPTFMGPDDMQFSGDWPGHLQRTLESLIGDGVTAMYYNGAEGDQAPLGRPDAGESRWERAERYGRDLGVVAWKQWQQTPVSADVPFAFHSHTIQLPQRSGHPDFLKTGGAEYGLSEELLEQMLPRLFPEKVDSISLRLGDLVVVGIPGEMAASLGQKIKTEAARATGAKCPAIGGLADMWISYMLPAEEYHRGGYESSVSFYGETLGDTVVEGAIVGVRELAK